MQIRRKLKNQQNSNRIDPKLNAKRLYLNEETIFLDKLKSQKLIENLNVLNDFPISYQIFLKMF